MPPETATLSAETQAPATNHPHLDDRMDHQMGTLLVVLLSKKIRDRDVFYESIPKEELPSPDEIRAHLMKVYRLDEEKLNELIFLSGGNQTQRSGVFTFLRDRTPKGRRSTRK